MLTCVFHVVLGVPVPVVEMISFLKKLFNVLGF